MSFISKYLVAYVLRSLKYLISQNVSVTSLSSSCSVVTPIKHKLIWLENLYFNCRSKARAYNSSLGLKHKNVRDKLFLSLRLGCEVWIIFFPKTFWYGKRAVFPKVRSTDHFWSAKAFILVREKKNLTVMQKFCKNMFYNP
jgi:hypothetical protein